MITRRCATCLVTNIGTLKFIFHISNLVCAFACIQVIIFGVVNLMDIEELDAISTYEYINSPHIVSILLGVFLLMNTCYGFSSAARQIPASMNCYAVMQLNIFVFCIITLCISDIEDSMIDAFQHVWNNRMTNSNFEMVLSRIQLKLECCGMNGPEDFYNSTLHIFATCCNIIEDSCKVHYVSPCRVAVEDWAMMIYIRFISSLAPTTILTAATFVISYYFSSAIILKPLFERRQLIVNDL